MQFLLPGGDAPLQPGGLAARRPRPVVIPPLPEYPAILRAPIFAPDRKPGPAAATGPAASSLGGYAVLGAVVGRSLASVVISGPGVAPKTLRRGDMLDGWRLVAVDTTKATFERSGLRHELIIGAPAEGVAGAEGAPAAATDAQTPPVEK